LEELLRFAELGVEVQLNVPCSGKYATQVLNGPRVDMQVEKLNLNISEAKALTEK